MQKTAVSTQSKGRTANYFKYEMKDTNQLLKNFFSCAVTDTITRSDENKQQIDIQDMFQQGLCLRKLENAVDFDQLRKLSQKKFNDSNQLNRMEQKEAIKYKEELQNDEDQIFKDIIYDSSLIGKRKKVDQNSIQDLILQKFYFQASENEQQEANKPSIQRYRNKESQINCSQRFQEIKQNKKQKKGLANISLRVKNIVSQHKRLTYKQVSDYVLQYSKDQIDQLQPSQRIKEIKNIKRRVYDALNVLVAVGILGKHQRCVCITEWTNIPGKRHATEWTKVNTKIDQLNKLKKNCADKTQALNLLINKYNSIAALRNKHLQDQKQQQVLFFQQQKVSKKQLKKLQMSKNEQQSVNLDKKLMFPVILFCPAFDQDPSDKLTVEFQQGENLNEEFQSQQESKRKVKISGKNITILGDFDCALEMDLQKYRDYEDQTKLLHQIEQYARQNTKQLNFQQKHQTDDFGQGSIDDYFNDQMFMSK